MEWWWESLVVTFRVAVIVSVATVGAAFVSGIATWWRQR